MEHKEHRITKTARNAASSGALELFCDSCELKQVCTCLGSKITCTCALGDDDIIITHKTRVALVTGGTLYDLRSITAQNRTIVESLGSVLSMCDDAR